MALVGSAIPNLINGVSQQPATQRLASQSEIQENGFSSIVEGLMKRNPTSSLAKLLSGQISDAFIHIINRDTTERYVVVVTQGNLRVFDFTGVEKTVTVPDPRNYTILGPVTALATGVAFLIAPGPGVTTLNFVVTGITTATVKLQGSVDGSTGWTDLDTRTTNGTSMGVSFAGFNYIRGTVSAYTSGTIELQVAYPHFRYLISALGTPSTAIRAVTIADFTFFVNTEKIVEADKWGGINGPAPIVPQGLAYVKQGNYGTKYNITLNGTTVTKTTSNTDVTDIATEKIATDLAAAINANGTLTTAGFSASTNGNIVKIIRTVSNTLTDFSMEVSDGNGGRNLIRVKDVIQKFSDLPPRAPANFLIGVAGDSATGTDDYYVKFQASSGFEQWEGTWKEAAAVDPTFTGGFKLDTMPHLLVRQADGTFLYNVANGGDLVLKKQWAARRAGDRTTNSDPSFTGKKIADVYFFRNRLGFIADENVILSEAGEYFNFFRTTVTQLLDKDPIDIAVSNVQVSILRNAVPFQQKLVLFSDQRQFILDAGDLLTPKTAAIKPTTVFESLQGCKPVVSGKNVYFPTPRGVTSGVREYLVDRDTNNDDAADVTAHVPAYVPANVFKMTAATNEDLLLLLSRNEQNAIYAYKYYWSGTDKLQSSWSKWLFPTNVKVLSADFINSTLYAVMQRPDGVYLESMGVEAGRKDAGLDFEVLLDRKITDPPATYSSNTNLTTWTLPYADNDVDTPLMVVVRADSGGHKIGEVPTISRPTSNTITTVGNLSAVPVLVGKRYRFKYRFSQFSVKEKNATTGAEKTLTGERLQVGMCKLILNRTGYFQVVVAAKDGFTATYVYTPNVIGTSDATVGLLTLGSGDFKFPVRSKSDRVTIDIISDSFLPLRIQSAEWEGQFYARSQRV